MKAVVDAYHDKSILRSFAAVGKDSERHPNTIRRKLFQVAAAVLYASCFLLGCFMKAWQRLFKQRFTPVAVIYADSYDETPLKLHLQEFLQFIGRAPAESAGLPASAMGQSYKYAKVLRVNTRMGNSSMYGVHGIV